MIIGLLLMAADLSYSQSWLPLGSGNLGHLISGNLVYDINISEDNQYIYLAGWIADTSTSPELKATITWDGQHYDQLANLGGASSISTIVFDFNGRTYSSGYLVSQPPPSSSYNDFNYKDENGNWALVSSSINGSIMDYHVKDGIVYLAGWLNYCDGVPCGLVCTYDGEQVLPYFQTAEPHGQYALGVTFYQDTLFVAGNINSPVSSEAQNGYAKLMKIVDGQLQKVGNGIALGGIGAGLEVLDNKLYAVGRMREIGGDQHHTIYYYENGQLHTLPEEPDGLIYSMTKYQGALYVAGGFTQIGNTPCSQVARWDGHEWTCLCYEPFTRVILDESGDTIEVMSCEGNCIRDIAVWNDTLYIAGDFHNIGNIEARHIAKLDMSLSEAFPVKVTEQQQQELKLHVYPNPAQEQLHITLPLGARPQDVLSVYDMHGRLVKEQSVGRYAGTITVDISRLSGGMYVVRYSGKDIVLVKQFVKE